ncbi:CDP-alcohol phosphatidyltransferase family protein [Streptomyces bobili]
MTEFAAVLKQLSTAQKPAKGASLYTLYVNRPAGRFLAALAHRAGATPNQLTVLSAVFTFPALAAVALIPPQTAMAVCVGAALVMGFALDAADGQLARSQRSGSPSGEWLDHVVDCVKVVALHLVVLVSFYRFFNLPSPLFLLAPMLFELAAVVIFFAGILTEKLKWRAPGQGTAPPPPALGYLRLVPGDKGFSSGSFLFLGNQDFFLTAYCGLLLAHVVFMGAFLLKWFRELR